MSETSSKLFDLITSRDQWFSQSQLDNVFLDSQEPIPATKLFDTSEYAKYQVDDDQYQLSLDSMSKLYSSSTKKHSRFDESVLRMFKDSDELEEEYREGLEWTGIQSHGVDKFSLSDIESLPSFVSFTSINGSQLSYPAVYISDPSITTSSLRFRAEHSALTNPSHATTMLFGMRRGVVIAIDTSLDESMRGIMSSALNPFFLSSMASEIVGILHSLSSSTDYVAIISSDGLWHGHLCYTGSDLEEDLDLDDSSEIGGLTKASVVSGRKYERNHVYEIVGILHSLSSSTDYVAIISSDGLWHGHLCYTGSDLEEDLDLDDSSEIGGLTKASVVVRDVLSSQIIEYFQSLTSDIISDSSQDVSLDSTHSYASKNDPIFSLTESGFTMLRSAIDPTVSLKDVITEKHNNIYGMSRTQSELGYTRPLPVGSPLILHVVSLGSVIHPYYSFFVRHLSSSFSSAPVTMFFTRMNAWDRMNSLCGICSLVNVETDGCSSVCEDMVVSSQNGRDATNSNISKLTNAKIVMMYDNVDVVWRIDKDIKRIKGWYNNPIVWKELVAERMDSYQNEYAMIQHLSTDFPFNENSSSSTSFVPSLTSMAAFTALSIYHLPTISSFVNSNISPLSSSLLLAAVELYFCDGPNIETTDALFQCVIDNIFPDISAGFDILGNNSINLSLPIVSKSEDDSTFNSSSSSTSFVPSLTSMAAFTALSIYHLPPISSFVNSNISPLSSSLLLAAVELYFCDGPNIETTDALFQCVIDNIFPDISAGFDILGNNSINLSLPIVSKSEDDSTFVTIGRGNSSFISTLDSSALRIQGYVTIHLNSISFEQMLYSFDNGSQLTPSVSYVMWFEPFTLELLSHPGYTSTRLLPVNEKIDQVEKLVGTDSNGDDLDFSSYVLKNLDNGVPRGQVVVRTERFISGSETYGIVQTQIAWITSTNGSVFIFSFAQSDMNRLTPGFTVPPKCDDWVDYSYSNLYTPDIDAFETLEPCYGGAMYAHFDHLSTEDQEALGLVLVDDDGTLVGVEDSQQTYLPLSIGLEIINYPMFFQSPELLGDGPMHITSIDQITKESVISISDFFSSDYPSEDDPDAIFYTEEYEHSVALLAMMSAPFLNYTLRDSKPMRYAVLEVSICFVNNICLVFPNGPLNFDYTYNVRQWYTHTRFQAIQRSLSTGAPSIDDNYYGIYDVNGFFLPPFITLPTGALVTPITMPVYIDGVVVGFSLLSIVNATITDLFNMTSCGSEGDSYCVFFNLQGDVIFSNGSKSRMTVEQYGLGATDSISITEIDPLVSLFLLDAGIINIRSSINGFETHISVDINSMPDSVSASIDGEVVSFPYIVSDSLPTQCLSSDSSDDESIVCLFFVSSNIVVCHVDGDDIDYFSVDTCVVETGSICGVSETYEFATESQYSLSAISHLWNKSTAEVINPISILSSASIDLSSVSTGNDITLAIIVLVIVGLYVFFKTFSHIYF
ncbi:hypothetical protein ADUPG1_006721 [Aduncisulcus paluster]|uniref:VWFA domain-containing protein n=1 Tax=Aduncisulcus paluster TaxID=2918883 RepID=A0ABQ5KJB0_9EUKA|nr:hypothetical protein ADUPG1_006721 [Aduncisulcus paluster]